MTNTENNQPSVPERDSLPAAEKTPADLRLEDIYRRIARGDTSVVTDVYWIQMFD